jgi:hypothetical protein
MVNIAVTTTTVNVDRDFRAIKSGLQFVLPRRFNLEAMLSISG